MAARILAEHEPCAQEDRRTRCGVPLHLKGSRRPTISFHERVGRHQPPRSRRPVPPLRQSPFVHLPAHFDRPTRRQRHAHRTLHEPSHTLRIICQRRDKRRRHELYRARGSARPRNPPHTLACEPARETKPHPDTEPLLVTDRASPEVSHRHRPRRIDKLSARSRCPRGGCPRNTHRRHHSQHHRQHSPPHPPPTPQHARPSRHSGSPLFALRPRSIPSHAAAHPRVRTIPRSHYLLLC